MVAAKFRQILAALTRVVHVLTSVENGLLALTLGLMMIVPLAEVVLRRTVRIGIANASGWVQHLVLLSGMLGGALAARQGRMLCMSALPSVLKGRWRTAADVFSGSVSVALTALLTWAGWQFVVAEREAPARIAYGVPTWVLEAFIPLGFALITWRLLRAAPGTWRRGLLKVAVAAGFVVFAIHAPGGDPVRWVVPALVVLLLATVLGAPVYCTLGGAALILFWGDGLPIASIPLDHYRLVTNPTLPTIPLFTLAGYFLAEGGASRRLIRVFQSLCGWFRGGPAVVTCLVCAFFTTFTGASGVTILALGGLLMPVLVAAHYSDRHALGLLTGAGSLGLLFPPCLPLILYAIVATNAGATVPITSIFLGGLLPGVLLVVMTAALGIWLGPRGEAARQRFDLREALGAMWQAKWELLLPAVAFGGLFSGLATPVETAAVTALYAFVIETFVYGDLHPWRDVPRVMTQCGLLIGGVLLILGVALGFTNYLVDAQVAIRALEWVQSTIRSPWVFLLVLNLFLLIVGCLMDIFSAIIVVVPLLAPMGEAFGIDPVHLGIIFLANLELGYLTPPVGMNLFLASYRFNRPLPEVYRSVVPMLFVRFVGVMLITYLPILTLALPRWLGS
ncbi:MAG: TRAP transporter large permease subunit [Lentisphaeria bacterium]|nr:TRAP transporter large permease subunit [Lentisphaeria bacterium]